MLAEHSSKIKMLKHVSTSIDTIDNSDIYVMYKDLYLSKKEREERLLQGIQLVSGLRVHVGRKKAYVLIFLNILCIHMDLIRRICLLDLN